MSNPAVSRGMFAGGAGGLGAGNAARGGTFSRGQGQRQAYATQSKDDPRRMTILQPGILKEKDVVQHGESEPSTAKTKPRAHSPSMLQRSNTRNFNNVDDVSNMSDSDRGGERSHAKTINRDMHAPTHTTLHPPSLSSRSSLGGGNHRDKKARFLRQPPPARERTGTLPGHFATS